MLATYLTPSALAAQCLRDDPSFRLLTPAEQRIEARSALALIAGCDADDIDLQLETIALATAPAEAAKTTTRIVDTGRKKIVVSVPAVEPVAAPVEALATPVAEGPAETLAEASGALLEVDRSDRVQWIPQACRNPAGCTETLAGTGRCMQCGAQRKPPKHSVKRPVDIDPVQRPDPALNPAPPKSKKATRIVTKVTKARKLNTAVVATPEAFARRRSELARGDILHRTKALTNAPDHYLAKVLNRSRASIQAYLNERIAFNPSKWQLQQLQQLLLQQRLMLDDALDTIEAALEHTRR
jgi:hypothetical protein